MVVAVLYREELVEYKTHKVVITTMECNKANSHIFANGAAILFELAKNRERHHVPVLSLFTV